MTREELLLLQEEAARRAAVARRSRWASDPVSFAVEALGYTPDPWQQRVLRWNGKNLLLNCSRQAGKSTTTAILAWHRAVFTPGALILLISPSERQSGELFRKVTDARKRMADPPKLVEDNKLSLALENGARIVSLPSSEDTIRGFSAVSLLVEDEAAFVDDALNVAVRPMVAVGGGQMILMSSPKGRRGHFFEAWERGGSYWDRERVACWDVPRIPREFLEAERRAMGEHFKQEYECQFINASAGRVYSAFDEERNVIDALPDAPSWSYLLGLDFGIVDRNAVSVVCWRDHDPTLYVSSSYKLKAIPSEMAAEVTRLRHPFERIIGDLGGMGKAFAEEARKRFQIPIEPADKHNKLGFIRILNGELAQGRVKVVRSACPDLIDEWLTLPWADGQDKEASGFDNHCADATLYAFRAAWSYLAEDAPKRLKPGTPEAHAEEERRMLEQAEAEYHKASTREWWEQ